jgi:hypothetical protein
LGGYRNNLVVGCAGVDHGHDADGAGFDERQRLNGLLAEDQDVERIVVFGVGLRNESVVGRIEDGGVDDAVHFEQAGGLIQFVLDVGAEGNFDDRLEVARDILAGRNVMPSVDHGREPRE